MAILAWRGEPFFPSTTQTPQAQFPQPKPQRHTLPYNTRTERETPSHRLLYYREGFHHLPSCPSLTSAQASMADPIKIQRRHGFYVLVMVVGWFVPSLANTICSVFLSLLNGLDFLFSTNTIACFFFTIGYYHPSQSYSDLVSGRISS